MIAYVKIARIAWSVWEGGERAVGAGRRIVSRRSSQDRDPAVCAIVRSVRSRGRTNGRSLSAIIVDVNRTMRGWFEYFKHSHKTTFPRLDKWVRMRLRSILRKRRGVKVVDAGQMSEKVPWDDFTFPGICNNSQAQSSRSGGYLFESDTDCLLGIRTKKVLPWPSSLSTQIRPSCSSTKLLATLSPKPAPP